MRNLIGKDTNRDVIIAYLSAPDAAEDTLTVKQQQLLDYYVDAYTLVRNYTSIPDAINILVKLSQKRGETISKATARRYIYDALEIFGYVSEMKTEAIQHLSTQIILDAIRMAKNAGDHKSMIDGAEKLHKINPKIDANTPNWDLLEPHQIVIQLDPGAQKVMEMLGNKGYVDLDKLMGNAMNSMAEEAQFDESGTED